MVYVVGIRRHGDTGWAARATVATMTRRRLLTVALVAAVVAGGALLAWSRSPGRQSVIAPAPKTTESSQLTFDAPPGTPVAMDSTTTTACARM